MICLRIILTFFLNWFTFLTHTLKLKLMSRTALELENIALRNQLAVFQQQTLNHKILKPRPTLSFRRLWVVISKLWPDWKSALLVVKPETVIDWHRTAFRFYWAKRSKSHGRPAISQATIALIKRIHQDNPLWSPERIHDQLIKRTRYGAGADSRSTD
jgi:putative transposase